MVHLKKNFLLFLSVSFLFQRQFGKTVLDFSNNAIHTFPLYFNKIEIVFMF